MLEAGSYVGRFKVVAKLGEGGMGEVWRARDEQLGRNVAIKLLPPDVAQDADRHARFEREARAAAALNHPNIMTVHDIGSHEGRPYLVTELLEGETLRERLAGGALGVATSVGYCLQITTGLAIAHDRGIVHRDLKPENLFITNEGAVKILDFGLAKVLRPTGPVDFAAETDTAALGTQPGTVLGTVGYMSPEQVRGGEVDQRSDIFALGVVLFEMLAGAQPFSGDTAMDTLSAILNQDPPELSALDPAIPPTLAEAVRRCLEKRPEDRFASAGELASVLQIPSGVTATLASAKPPAWRRVWVPALAVGGLVLGLVAVLGGKGLLGERATPGGSAKAIGSLAVLPLDNLSGDPDQQYFADGMTEALIADLGKAGGLKVISRTSVMRYRASTKSVQEIAEELGVEALIEGSVLSSGGRVRITVQLIEAATDSHLWAESYERELDDVIALQADVAREVAREVGANIGSTGKERRVVPEAYDAYLRAAGQYPEGPSDIQTVIANLERAIELDPGFAPAYAALSEFHGYLSMRGLQGPAEGYVVSLRLARKAVELDPDNALAHTALGRVLWQHEWDWAGAEAEYRRALELNPNAVLPLALYGAYLALMGDCEDGIHYLESALEREPLDFAYHLDLSIYLYHCRRFDESIAALDKATELAPGVAVLEAALAWNYLAKGWRERAVTRCSGAVDTLAGQYDPLVLSTCAVVAGQAERDELAQELVARLRRPPQGFPVEAHWLSLGCFAIGEEDCAFDELERAYRERSPSLVFLKDGPTWDPWRDDPRFQAVLDRMNFPD